MVRECPAALLESPEVLLQLLLETKRRVVVLAVHAVQALGFFDAREQTVEWSQIGHVRVGASQPKTVDFRQWKHVCEEGARSEISGCWRIRDRFRSVLDDCLAQITM